MKKIYLKRTSRIRAGHLWVFSNEVSSNLKDYEPGSIVEVFDKGGELLGTGYVNPSSLISIRLLSKGTENIDLDFFVRKIRNALNYRNSVLPGSDSYRLVFSESDLLPGLIIDKYGECFTVQILTMGMERLTDLILQALDEVLSPKAVILKNDSQIRRLEGLPLEKRIAKGAIDVLPIIHEGDVRIEVDPLSGQKTGFFLDQRENRLALKKLVHGGKALDLFCYSGGWGLQLLGQGAHVDFVDDSEGALTQARRNALLNGYSDNCSFITEDVFSFLKGLKSGDGKYDVIALDPPAFAKSGQKVKEGLRGYREINARAMGLLNKGGILATSSCSYHIDRETFLGMLRDAARDAGKYVRIIEFRGQGRDHPVLLSVPETEYLKCAFLEVL